MRKRTKHPAESESRMNVAVNRTRPAPGRPARGAGGFRDKPRAGRCTHRMHTLAGPDAGLQAVLPPDPERFLTVSQSRGTGRFLKISP